MKDTTSQPMTLRIAAVAAAGLLALAGCAAHNPTKAASQPVATVVVTQTVTPQAAATTQSPTSPSPSGSFNCYASYVSQADWVSHNCAAAQSSETDTLGPSPLPTEGSIDGVGRAITWSNGVTASFESATITEDSRVPSGYQELLKPGMTLVTVRVAMSQAGKSTLVGNPDLSVLYGADQFSADNLDVQAPNLGNVFGGETPVKLVAGSPWTMVSTFLVPDAQAHGPLAVGIDCHNDTGQSDAVDNSYTFLDVQKVLR